ncbi:MarR family transcriptional regulator [Salinicola corii]|uniref:MarR family transcriptional regulator n=1 Tax=Salinicola corii TaxID=2606937 RepID=A0A640W924_9GAMM|nr:MarR family transcriptional regulator [Salinicola corii]KAA0016271.1 MarR family transcriptional regulator [Salinicola corii]
MSETTFGESLHQLMHAYKRALRQAYADAELDLTVSHIRTLKAIRGQMPCTARAIAQRTQRDKGQITRLLRDLLDANIIVKAPHPEDGRSQMLSLTGHGRSLLESVDTCEREAHEQLSNGMTQADLDAFLRLSRLMISNLKSRESRCPNPPPDLTPS